MWNGKDALDETDLFADAPAIYIQEKIDPRVIIENLRNTAALPEDEPELTLFDTFDGLGELDLVDFYRHEANWSNRMILGDSLNVMASLAEREALPGKVQMIYIDPPYGIKFGSNWQVSARKRDVKDGKLEDATREVEQIKAFRDTWELGIHSYLTYLRDRLQVAKDLLTESGSVFVQIGDENVHLVRSLMDEVFGRDNFVALIPFQRRQCLLARCLLSRWPTSLSGMPKTGTWRNTGNSSGPKSQPWATTKLIFRMPVGCRSLGPPGSIRCSQRGAPFGLRNPSSLKPSGPMESGRFSFMLDGVEYSHPKNGYSTDPTGMRRLAAAGRLIPAGSLLRYLLYADDKPLGDLTVPWNDTVGADDKMYVVQTNTRVVERCMLMTTDPEVK
ncbi:MAG: DNA methyltransferase [Acidimicrobiales bacterium]